MFIHEKLMLCALDLANEYHLEAIATIGMICQAGHELSELNDNGIRKLHEELKARAQQNGVE